MFNLILVVYLSQQFTILNQLYRLWVMALMIIYNAPSCLYMVEFMHVICRSALPQKFYSNHKWSYVSCCIYFIVTYFIYA